MRPNHAPAARICRSTQDRKKASRLRAGTQLAYSWIGHDPSFRLSPKGLLDIRFVGLKRDRNQGRVLGVIKHLNNTPLPHFAEL